MKKYFIKEQLYKIISRYEKQTTDHNLIFRIVVDSRLPEELSGDIDSIFDAMCMLLDEAFSHTEEGKIILKMSDGREDMAYIAKTAVGEKIPVIIEVADTGNHYDTESERVKDCRAKLIFLDSSLQITRRDNLGAKVSFTVMQCVESKETVEEFNYVIKNFLQETQEPEEAELIKGVDFDKGLLYVQGNQAIYEDLMVQYVKSREDFLSRLAEYYAAEDWANYRIVAHSIKSSSYSIGADELGNLAKELEFAARDRDLNCIHKKHTYLRESFAEIAGNVEAYLQNKGIAIGKQPSSDKEKLIAAIDDFDKEAALEILDRLSEAGENAEIIEELRTKLEDLDYFGAGELAQNL